MKSNVVQLYYELFSSMGYENIVTQNMIFSLKYIKYSNKTIHA
jgi:hypothetical protein